MRLRHSNRNANLRVFMDSETSNQLRKLPSISDFLESDAGKTLSQEFGKGLTKLALNTCLHSARETIRNNPGTPAPDNAALQHRITANLTRWTNPEARRVLNATGILLHTGLGRAPMSAAASQAMVSASGSTPVEIDPLTGKRSIRGEYCERMLKQLTGCEAVIVVNNNAAATFLILNTIAENKEVIISRGQLIEIGGSYRLPDVMNQSRALMKEVGTTNRTHLSDYHKAINEATGALIHVHTSNFRIRGFCGTPDVQELAKLAHKHHLPLIADIGSGALIDLQPLGIPDEPLVQEAISNGADLVCFSGDKLLGGPQCGIICGSRKWIDQIRSNSFTRMFRIGKLIYAALESTLVSFVNQTIQDDLPIYEMMNRSLEQIGKDAELLLSKLPDHLPFKVVIEDDVSYIGGGSVPDEGIPTKVIKLKLSESPESMGGIESFATRLRRSIPSVFARINDEAVLLDLRTVQREDLTKLGTILNRTLTDHFESENSNG
ncbi:MAG TPA: L-seryl-tRNA(Sec) selenium transferase [Verrucomicrobiales bacterium]|nr:L-seryl-tRNA(Sec) selenium transferase [Verrucomicrobiales bacterium]